MMRIETIMVGQMGTNCYLAWDEESKRGFLVDPGEQADKIIRVCSRYEIKPEAILLTHGHFDHIMAAKKVKEYYQIPVYAGIHEEELLADAEKNLSAMWAEGFTIHPVGRSSIPWMIIPEYTMLNRSYERNSQKRASTTTSFHRRIRLATRTILPRTTPCPPLSHPKS